MDGESRLSVATLSVASLIVIVSLLAGIPALVRARIAANEAAAIGDTRAVQSAENTFASVNCGLFDDVTHLCEDGPDCLGISIAGYEGPAFLDGDLARSSPYTRDGYERKWIPVDFYPAAARGCRSLSPASSLRPRAWGLRFGGAGR
jgi:hypothetical protein